MNDPLRDADALNAQVIAKLAQQALAVRLVNKTDDGQPLFHPVATIAGNPNPVSLEKFLEHPLRARARLELNEAASFIEYLKVFGHLDSTRVFGVVTEIGAKFIAFIDYLESNQDAGEGVQGSWCEHWVVLRFDETPEWRRWTGTSGKELTQLAFAEFLEDNAPDVFVPEGSQAINSADLIAVALTLQAKTDVDFGSAIRLDNGQVQLKYEERITAQAGQSGTVKIPQAFFISIAPFVGTPRYLVQVRLRYRLASGKLTFRFLLDRPHKVIETVATDVRQRIKAETGHSVLLGEVKQINAINI